MTDDAGDDPIARLQLLERLDPLGASAEHALNPDYRTIGGQPLSEEEADLLLSCTAEDIHALAASINGHAEYLNEYAELLRATTATIDEYRAVVAPFDQGDGDERAFMRMPAEQRRQARRLQNKITTMQDEINRHPLNPNR